MAPVSAGLLAALVGFASSFAIVLQGLTGVGASPDEAASGLVALCVVQGLLGIYLALRYRQPISLAWSTPGAALLMSGGAPKGGFGVAVTAFIITGLLIAIAGLWRPLRQAVARIPLSLASAMLAGVLMELCLAPVQAAAKLPTLALPIIAAWVLGWCLARRYAVLIAVVVMTVIVIATTSLPAAALHGPTLVFVRPVPDWLAAVSIAIPLFIVTMASQNVPGLAVLKTNGYDAPIGPSFVSTGLGSAVAALFGAHALNLSAITAALCAGPQAGADRSKRYLAAATVGATYVLILGPFAGFASALVVAAPPLLIQTVAGLALLGSLITALEAALHQESHRLAAIVTFVTSASGVSILGLGAPFWGLVGGGALLWMEHITTQRQAARPPKS